MKLATACVLGLAATWLLYEAYKDVSAEIPGDIDEMLSGGVARLRFG